MTIKKFLAKASRLITGFSVLYGLYLLILLTIPYFTFQRDTDFLLTKRLVVHHDYYMAAFWCHIFTSPVLVLTGLLQFSGKIINSYPSAHRLAGKIYLVTLLFISAPGALILAFYANGYLVTKISFIVLTLLWITFSILGYKTIRKRNFEAHGNFILRSYGLTLSAITLRFYAYLLAVFHSTLLPKDAYLLIALLSWIPNLIIAEILIRKGFIRSVMSRIKE